MGIQRYFPVFLSFFLFISCTKETSLNKIPVAATPLPSIRASEMLINDKGLSDMKAIITTIHGNIVFKFYPQKAPNTVTRIVQLIQNGFYNGIAFHRVESNYVIQTGDPTGTGTGGSGYKLKAEFNDIPHTKGIVAMARAIDPDSADSQFYISLGTLTHLDGQYTVFGKVIEGEDLLSKIAVGDKILSLTLEK